jgi:hypothetical protein
MATTLACTPCLLPAPDRVVFTSEGCGIGTPRAASGRA